MHKSLIPLLVFVILTLAGCKTLRYQDNFVFFQMADTQFGFFNENKEFSRETVNFEKAIAQANRLKPAFVIVCGDLVNRPGDPEQIGEYKRIASTLDPAIKLYNVAGNHDVENAPTENAIDTYRKHFGPDRYTFRSGNIYGIVLNSSLIKDASKFPEEAAEQEKWFQMTLEDAKKSKSTNIIVFVHYPFFLNTADEPEEYFNIDKAKRKWYLDLFHRYGVRQVFAGHYHRNAGGRDGDLEMITTGPVGRPLGKDGSGFRVVTVQGKSVTHQYYVLDSLPQTIRINAR